MTKVIFKSPDKQVELDSSDDISVMQLAKNGHVLGIDADCGGSMVCGTCHVYVDAAYFDQLPEPSDMESSILECVPAPHPRARLSCQLRLQDVPDGMVVELPPSQR